MENKSENNRPAEKAGFEDRLPEEEAPSGPGGKAAGGGTAENGPGAAPVTAEPQTAPDTGDKDRPAAPDCNDAPRLGDGSNLDVILGIPLDITVELGRVKMPIHELLRLGPGSAVALSRLEGEPVDILANRKLIARGVVLVKDEKYGIRITETTGGLERLRGLR